MLTNIKNVSRLFVVFHKTTGNILDTFDNKPAAAALIMMSGNVGAYDIKRFDAGKV